MSAEIIITGVMLGIGLAMDAFSVSIANGLADRHMDIRRMLVIAGTFAAFQFVMPMTGWFLVKRAAEKFEWFRPFIPWIALVLLLIIGIGLIKDGIEEHRAYNDTALDAPVETASSSQSPVPGEDPHILSAWELFVQGIATSIDALSVGFTTASYSLTEALVSSFVIGTVTLAVCMAGLRIGRRLGELLKGRASVLGGVILIAIGLEIWVKGVFF